MFSVCFGYSSIYLWYVSAYLFIVDTRSFPLRTYADGSASISTLLSPREGQSDETYLAAELPSHALRHSSKHNWWWVVVARSHDGLGVVHLLK